MTTQWMKYRERLEIKMESKSRREDIFQKDKRSIIQKTNERLVSNLFIKSSVSYNQYWIGEFKWEGTIV